MTVNFNIITLDIGKGKDNKVFKLKDIKPSKKKHMVYLIKIIASTSIKLGECYSLRNEYLKALQSIDLANWYANKALPITHKLLKEITDEVEIKNKELHIKFKTSKMKFLEPLKKSIVKKESSDIESNRKSFRMSVDINNRLSKDQKLRPKRTSMGDLSIAQNSENKSGKLISFLTDINLKKNKNDASQSIKDFDFMDQPQLTADEMRNLLTERLKGNPFLNSIEINSKLHEVNKEKTKSVTLGPQLTKNKVKLKRKPSQTHRAPLKKSTIQNPDDYFHHNICTKFNVKGKPKKGINMEDLANAKSEVEKILLSKNMTGFQKRK